MNEQKTGNPFQIRMPGTVSTNYEENSGGSNPFQIQMPGTLQNKNRPPEIKFYLIFPKTFCGYKITDFQIFQIKKRMAWKTSISQCHSL